ncbi:MAG TPA: response regulator transcription factor [Anaerolineales bacterium]|jgi:DNA-binding NarL/FixJ family response regulator|nr:response regulator transcription factor [Anaerolineales bacterium]
MENIRVFLADDHDLFREGLAGIIASQADMEVVGEASDGLEAIVKALELRPDLILMDIQMPGCDGLEATKQIKKELPETTIVVLTVRDEDEKLFQAIKNGAQGYLLKTIRSREMLGMLRGAMQGEAAISPNLAGRMLEEFRRLSKLAPVDLDEEIISLTQREQEVLSLVATGASDKEIAENLYISLHTVKSHMRNILAKLQVNSRREAARLARQKGLL